MKIKGFKVIGAIALILVFSILLLYSFNTNTFIPPENNLTYEKSHFKNVYGNTDVDIDRFISKNPGKRFAFIMGVHPYEWEAHNAFYEAIHQFTLLPEFKGEIDIYWVHVPYEEGKFYDQGRSTGEISTASFVLPLLKKEKYDAIFDIHSAMEGYPYKGDPPYKGGPKWYLYYSPNDESYNLSYNISKSLGWVITLDEDEEYSVDKGDDYNEDDDRYDIRILNPMGFSGTPFLVLEWGWCKPESLWKEQEIIDLNATDPGEYEDKLKHALIFLEKIQNT
jgi:hypothetical protein